MRPRFLLLLTSVLFGSYAQAQLVVDGTLTPAQLVQNVLLGGGVTISNVTFNGGTPDNLEAQAASFQAPVGSNLELVSGVILSTGYAATDTDNFQTGADGVVDDFASGSLFGISDSDLEALSGQTISDAAILEFDFIPTGDSLQFRYVFGSEEYPSFTCSNFNDAFGFFLSGPGLSGPFSNGAVNIALVPGTNVPVSINTLNSGVSSTGDDTDCAAADPNWQDNSIYFVDNGAQTGSIVTYDGFTTVLTAFALVQCGELYHIKLAIGDGFDEGYDSGVFLEAGSFTSSGQVVPELVSGVGIIGNTMMEDCVPVELIFTRQGDLSAAEMVDITVSGTATPGEDYSPALPTQLDFAAGDSTVSVVLTVPSDPDGPETLIVTISQLIVCANASVETVFEFNIDSPSPLEATGSDIDAVCGDVNELAPVITGGVGQYEFLWSTGETTPTITVSPEVTTSYDFTVTDACGVEPFYGTLTVTLPVYLPLEIEVSPDVAIPCLDSDVISVVDVSGGNGVYGYTWTQAGTVVGSNADLTVDAGPPLWYLVTVSEGCGSSVQDSVQVTTVPLDPIVVTTTENVTVICPGDSTVLEVLGVEGGNGVYTYAWSNGQGPLLSTATSLEVGVPVDATYTVTVEDQCGTVGSAQVSTLLPQYAPFQVSANADHTICFGDSTSAQVTVTGGSGYYFIDWVDRGWTDPFLKVIPTEETTYVVNVTDRCGQVISDEVTVFVEAVYIDITVTNRGQDDWYLQAATVPIALTHVWDMGDGTVYRNDEVLHSYMTVDQDFWATLRITTDNGCVGVDSVLLEPPAHIYFPNAFTPDGDGLNEGFGPVGHDIDDFEMTIFNRWGEVVFTTTSTDKPWYGDVNGGDQATSGVYVYKYRAAGHYFPSTEGYGHVTLLKGAQD